MLSPQAVDLLAPDTLQMIGLGSWALALAFVVILFSAYVTEIVSGVIDNFK